MKKHCIVFLYLLTILLQAPGQEKTFTISTSYKNLLSNPEGSGMLDKIMGEAFRRIGLKAEIVFTPTAKSLVDVNAGLLDAELNRIEGMEADYPNLVRVRESNMIMNFVAFSRRKIKIDGWESLRPLSIGIVKGWKILENGTKGFPRVVFVPSETELFTMLRKDRIDIALYSDLTGYATLKEMDVTGIIALEPPLAEREMFLYVHKRHTALADDIAKALRSMKKDGTHGRIVEETARSVRGR
jgi:polar amino acid transport system substrate-binding protein